MLLTIHDRNMVKVGFIDNKKQKTLNYYADKWVRNLESGASTFEFTVFKKTIQSDTAHEKAYNLLHDKAYISFKHDGKSYVFNIMRLVEDEKTITCYCENLSLSLINAYSNPYKAERAMTFEEYCIAFDLLTSSQLTIGINEISEKKLKLDWDGQETKLARLISLVHRFGAEMDFETLLYPDSSLKQFTVNIYRAYDGDAFHGVGQAKQAVLRYGKHIESIVRTIDKTNIYNAVRPVGKNDDEKTVTIDGLDGWESFNDAGVREFYQSGDVLYAPLSMQDYPASFAGDQNYIVKDIEVDSDNPNQIRAVGIRNLKKNAYPAVTYEVTGNTNLNIGDTIKIMDDGFHPTLFLEARVVEQIISFTQPNQNKTIFGNFKALENRLSDKIRDRLEELVDSIRPYILTLSTDNGTVFKNGQGETLVNVHLSKGIKPVDNAVFKWSFKNQEFQSNDFTVRSGEVNETEVLTVSALIGDTVVAKQSLTFISIFDGRDGNDGVAGRDGVGIKKTTITYASSTNSNQAPHGGWQQTVPHVLPGQYLWTKTVWTYTDGKTEVGYNVSRIGQDGNTGRDGVPGKDGVGIRDTTISYAQSSSGTVAPSGGWREQVPVVSPGQYLWTKTVWTYTDGTSETGYSVAYKAVDGQPSHIHFAYADSQDGRQGFSFRSNGQRYRGHYSDNNRTPSQDPTAYSWIDTLAHVEMGIRNYAEDYYFTKGLWEYSQGDNSPQNINFNDGSYTLTTTTRTWHQLQIHSESGGRLGGKADSTALAELIEGETYTLSVEVKVNSGDDMIWLELRDNGRVNYNHVVTHIGGSSSSNLIRVTNQWKRYEITGVIKPNNDFSHRRIILGYNGIGSVSFRKVELTKSSTFVDAGVSQNDIRRELNSKAEQSLTEEQLNALREQQEIQKVELEAKASLEVLNEWREAYEAFVNENRQAQSDSESALIKASARVSALETEFGEFKELKIFMTKYISSSEEGLILGKHDGSTAIRIDTDRISMMSAGREVMYISQGVIHIDNGIFTKTVQVGNFREEQYHLNQDMNVIRFVKG
ncbi:phage tail spike protein [Streptococcus fryi]